ncbi:transposase [Streptomyces sp. NPDC049837]|uniref:transposase n=1 Tax=Streptomyces sp. NPDC049837 TaxID=3155277 RepID=UPI0034455D22
MAARAAPACRSYGRRCRQGRTLRDGIGGKFRTGVAWRHVLKRYGPWATLHTRLRRWAKDRTGGTGTPGRARGVWLCPWRPGRISSPSFASASRKTVAGFPRGVRSRTIPPRTQ